MSEMTMQIDRKHAGPQKSRAEFYSVAWLGSAG
jgi:hypothetical protein